MSEEAMERAVQEALAREGVGDEVLAAGQFNPRGHTGSMFGGGLAGGSIGEVGGSIGEAVCDVAGAAAGMRANEAASGMPQWMLVGVTADAVYGFEGRSRSKEPGAMVFKADRAGLEVKMHQRVNVRCWSWSIPKAARESSSRETGSRWPIRRT
jgi:hypothetical protein